MSSLREALEHIVRVSADPVACKIAEEALRTPSPPASEETVQAVAKELERWTASGGLSEMYEQEAARICAIVKGA